MDVTTPQRRSARQATDCSSGKRRKLIYNQRGEGSSKAAAADASNTRTPEVEREAEVKQSAAVAVRSPASPSPTKKRASRVRFAGRDKTPTSPRPVLSQDVAEAFEIASPGSASPVKRTVRPRQEQQQELSASPSKLTPGPLAGPSSPLKKGIAARMGKAKRPLPVSDAQDGDKIESSLPLSQSSQEANTSGSRVASPHPFTSTRNSRQVSPSRSSHEPDSHARNAVNSESQRGRPRTYGAGVRSYLAVMPSGEAAANGGDPPDSLEPESQVSMADRWPPETQESQQRESYAEMRQKWVIEEAGAGGSLDVEAGAQPALKSLTSLRSVGSLKRFMDELDYTLAGLEPETNSLSARQASSIEIARNLCGKLKGTEDREEQGTSVDADEAGGEDSIDGTAVSDSTTFLVRLKAADAYGKVWTALRAAEAGNGKDEILDWALVIVLDRLIEPRIMGTSLFDTHASDIWAVLRTVLEKASEGARSKNEIEEAGQSAKSSKSKKVLRRLEVQRAALNDLSAQIGLIPVDALGQPSLLLAALSITDAVAQLPATASLEPRKSILERPLTPHDLTDEAGNDTFAGKPPATIVGAVARELRRQAGIAACKLVEHDAGADMLSSSPSGSSAPSMDVLGAIARLVERLVGSLDEVATGGTTTALADDECKPLLADYVVDAVRYLRAHTKYSSFSPSSSLNTTLQALATMGDWLKVLIALTQGNEAWCKAVSNSDGAVELILSLIVELSETMNDATLARPALSASPAAATFVESRQSPRKSQGNSSSPQAPFKSSAASRTASNGSSDSPTTAIGLDAIGHDVLCLAVALVTNLLEHYEGTAQRLTNIRLGMSAEGQGRSGSGECQGQLAVTMLFGIVTKSWRASASHVEKATHAPDDADRSVSLDVAAADFAILRASIALALGLAISHHPENASCLEEQQGGASAALEKLASILEDLAPLHRDVIQRAHGEGSGEEEGRGEEDVVEKMAAMLRGMTAEFTERGSSSLES